MTDDADDKPVPAPAPAVSRSDAGSEEWKERGVFWLAFFYIVGTHFLLAFMALLFYVGDHANK